MKENNNMSTLNSPEVQKKNETLTSQLVKTSYHNKSTAVYPALRLDFSPVFRSLIA